MLCVLFFMCFMCFMLCKFYVFLDDILISYNQYVKHENKYKLNQTWHVSRNCYDIDDVNQIIVRLYFFVQFECILVFNYEYNDGIVPSSESFNELNHYIIWNEKIHNPFVIV